MKSEIVAALNLFNEKFEKLKTLSFTANLPGSGFHYKADQEKGEIIERHGPQGEAIDAFVLTYRFFIQDNERSSLRNLCEIYNSPLINIADRNEYSEMRDALNKYLDEDSLIQFSGKKISRRYVQDVFIYGRYAHAKPEKEEVFKKWNSMDSFYFLMIENEFINTVGIVLGMLKYISELNKKVITALG